MLGNLRKVVTGFVFAIFTFALGCSGTTPREKKTAATTAAASSDYGPPEIAGTIESDDIKESSGLAASRCQENVVWTHNDGGAPLIFAMSSEGRHLGVWLVPNASDRDWEDIAISKGTDGKCSLLIGDIGDNNEDRSELEIYRVPEPQVSPTDSASTAKTPLSSAPADVLSFRYPDTAHNAETLLVHPVTGDIYILTKRHKGPSAIYKLKPVFGEAGPQTAQKLGEISVPAEPPGLLTGGSISPDGKRVILCDVQSGYELTLQGEATAFDDIWKQTPRVVDLGKRKQGEGVSYSADGGAVYASSERKGSPLVRVKRL